MIRWLGLALALLLLPTWSRAFPWMIEHGYNGCNECHVDPSGGSVLTNYGRAQGEILVRTHYKKMEGEPGKEKEFLWSVPLPDGLLIQPEFRGLFIPDPSDIRFILMQADMKMAANTKTFIASGSMGFVSEGARGALITKDFRNVRLVAREYWVGVRANANWTVRAGRMNLPFGIRTDQHILYTRGATRTDTNDDQQLGVSAAYGGRKLRSEVMAILGNYHISPDAYRERGYSGYVGFAPVKGLEVGISSLVTYAGKGLETEKRTIRQAHGLFARYSPVKKFGMFLETNALINTVDGNTVPGFVSDFHLDGEPVQGLHLKVGGEYCQAAFGETRSDARAWGAIQWFLAPHVDLRTDILYGPISCGADGSYFPSAAIQLHFYL